jgi:hypothetical protein
LNPNLFVVIRQNRADNQIIFEAAKADITMQPSQIIANHIRVLLTTPKLVDFLRLTKLRGSQWTRQLVTRLKKELHSMPPEIWQMTINQDSTPALWEFLKENLINLRCLQMDPRDRDNKLACLPLLLIRGEEKIQLPDDTECLRQGDQVLWCGKPGAASWMEWTLRDPLVLTYLATGQIVSRSYVWRWLQNK